MFRKFDYDAKTGKGSSGLEDMVLISKISEDSIVDNIKKRYNDDLIYTYIGPILIAVNPYKQVPYFTQNEIDMYNGCTPHEVPPHIYALTDHMYREMLIDSENQCVIISGESGAGKTVSAKYIMSYIASIAPKAPDLDNVKHIILESNPLLEAFGNAKTVRNNNSSRFGKYFQIEFSRGGVPDGGKILNFLLEKSRVVYQQSGERNFHVFYQMAKGCTKEEREWLGLAAPEFFFFLNQGGTYDADGQDDPKDYKEMRHAMDVCGIDGTQQQGILQLMGAILHLGNISFAEKGNNAVVREANSLEYPAYLLGVDAKALNEKVTSRLMQTGGAGGRSSMYNVPLNIDQATFTRNALAKAIYSRVFDWIVEAINRKLVKATSEVALGVLDIYGFEIFERNGFEQFCINYVNEKLQQIFIELTLKAEQEEYASEGIQWQPIDFFNNKIVCELIEGKKPAGLMAVLDDVCATMHGQSEGADNKFVEKASGAVASNPHFTPMQGAFIIKHYAGNVTYTADGFCESNRDTLYKDLIILMQSTNNAFVRALFPEDTTQDDKKRPTTAAFKIRNQANLLVETLMKCTPHYIRCIKPNETKRPKDWDQQRVLHQVRYLNLKENIRIRRAGFAYRQLFDKFLRRFAILTPETFPLWQGQQQQGIQHIMRSIDMDPTQFQLGRTKVFIKAPESLFMLEEVRARKYHSFAVKIQRAYRTWKARKYFLELKARSQDLLFGQKERKRLSLKREYIGDYIGYLDNPALRALMGKQEKVLFADKVIKYDRRFKPQSRIVLMSDRQLAIVALEPAKEGPNKGKLMYLFKRQIQLVQIEAVSMSTLADDYVCIHVPNDYDQVFETVFKTELVTLLSEKLRENGRQLRIMFNDNIQYLIKKGKKGVIKFQRNDNVQVPTMKSGTVMVRTGMPKDSRNMQPAAAAPQQRRAAPQQSGGGRAPPNGGQRPPPQQQQQPAYSPPQQQQAYAPPQAARPPGAVPGMGSRPGPPQMGGGAPPMGMPMGGAARPGPRPGPGGAAPGPGAAMAAAAAGGAARPPMQAGPAAVGIGGRPAPRPVPGGGRPPPPVSKPNLPRCKALYPYSATEADELTLEAGDVITITNKENEGWWEGTCKGRKGLFPSNYVEMLS